MFVKLIAIQTCETQVLQDQDPDWEQAGIIECQGTIPSGAVVYVTYGERTVETWCRSCAKTRFGLELT